MEQAVEELLRNFVKLRLPSEDGETEIDDVLLTYVSGILDEIASGEAGDDFDVDEFADVMSAYLPGFESIDRGQVYEWMFFASQSLKESPSATSPVDNSSSSHVPSTQPEKKAVNNDVTPSTGVTKPSEEECSNREVKSVVTDTESVSLADTGKQPAASRRAKRKGSSSAGSPPRTQPHDVPVAADSLDTGTSTHETAPVTSDENSATLQDMFAEMSVDEVHKALLKSDGVLEVAIGILLEEQSDKVELPARHTSTSGDSSSSQGQGVVLSKSPPARGGIAAPAPTKKVNSDATEKARLKDFVLGKYMHIDEAEDERQHRPHLQQQAKSKQKTMYRDNHVVNTKGEKYTVMTKKDHENDDMKKTYVSLKPMRKYRFH